ncbi:MAG: J domain-containing protein [Actinomycetota bacterium]|nr:J domain-containing protein [Actinomycetota bacterium]
MLTRAKLDQINERPHEEGRSNSRRLLPLMVAATATLALASFVLLSPYAALAVVLIGSLVLLLAHRKEREGGAVHFSYAALDPESASRFAEISEALKGLASSEMLWSVAERPEKPDKPGGIVPAPERGPARVGLLETPGISADVDVWGVEAEGQRVFFFPEGLLLYREGRYKAVSYGSLKVSFSNVRLGEAEGVPKGAEVVGSTWRYVREDGAPERRRSDNPEIPVVLYGLLEISGPSGLLVRLLASDRKAALSFARTFGAKGIEEGRSGEAPRERRRRKPRKEAPSPEELREAQARAILSVGAGASMQEVTLAYRGMARLYHPDKVANLPEEDREAAEVRMKQINAAYSDLKLSKSATA